MGDRLFLFVDESGQDTHGKLFLVGIVAIKDNPESYRVICESAEQASGKAFTKWADSGVKVKLNYIGRILHEPAFIGCLFFALFHDTKNYQAATVETITRALACIDSPASGATVFIDALPKSNQQKIALDLRRMGTGVNKVRGIRRDENDSLIRLADSLCGLARMAHAGNDDMQELLDWAIRSGAIRDLNK